MPDLNRAFMDPNADSPTLSLIADVYDATTFEPFVLGPRSVMKRADSVLKALTGATSVLLAPEYEFFIFEEARYNSRTDPRTDPRGQQFPDLPRDLLEAAANLEKDRDFLTRDGVFPPELLEMWVTAKKKSTRTCSQCLTRQSSGCISTCREPL